MRYGKRRRDNLQAMFRHTGPQDERAKKRRPHRNPGRLTKRVERQGGRGNAKGVGKTQSEKNLLIENSPNKTCETHSKQTQADENAKTCERWEKSEKEQTKPRVEWFLQTKRSHNVQVQTEADKQFKTPNAELDLSAAGQNMTSWTIRNKNKQHFPFDPLEVSLLPSKPSRTERGKWGGKNAPKLRIP